MAILNTADHLRISAAVAAAENHTAGEIVTIITDQSDGYTDVVLAWGAFAAFTALLVLALLPDFYLGVISTAAGRWNMQWTPGQIFGLAAMVAMAKFLAMVLLQMWTPLRFALLPGVVKTARVHSRAIGLFRVGAERRTMGRTGILIYLSMREHRAEILADEAIASKVPPEVWGEAMAAMLGELKQGRVADGMIAAVERVGAVLAQHLPREMDDSNELPDRLIEL